MLVVNFALPNVIDECGEVNTPCSSMNPTVNSRGTPSSTLSTARCESNASARSCRGITGKNGFPVAIATSASLSKPTTSCVPVPASVRAASRNATSPCRHHHTKTSAQSCSGLRCRQMCAHLETVTYRVEQIECAVHIQRPDRLFLT